MVGIGGAKNRPNNLHDYFLVERVKKVEIPRDRQPCVGGGRLALPLVHHYTDNGLVVRSQANALNRRLAFQPFLHRRGRGVGGLSARGDGEMKQGRSQNTFTQRHFAHSQKTRTFTSPS